MSTASQQDTSTVTVAVLGPGRLSAAIRVYKDATGTDLRRLVAGEFFAGSLLQSRPHELTLYDVSLENLTWDDSRLLQNITHRKAIARTFPTATELSPLSCLEVTNVLGAADGTVKVLAVVFPGAGGASREVHPPPQYQQNVQLGSPGRVGETQRTEGDAATPPDATDATGCHPRRAATTPASSPVESEPRPVEHAHYPSNSSGQPASTSATGLPAPNKYVLGGSPTNIRFSMNSFLFPYPRPYPMQHGGPPHPGFPAYHPHPGQHPGHYLWQMPPSPSYTPAPYPMHFPSPPIPADGTRHPPERAASPSFPAGSSTLATSVRPSTAPGCSSNQRPANTRALTILTNPAYASSISISGTTASPTSATRLLPSSTTSTMPPGTLAPDPVTENDEPVPTPTSACPLSSTNPLADYEATASTEPTIIKVDDYIHKPATSRPLPYPKFDNADDDRKKRNRYILFAIAGLVIVVIASTTIALRAFRHSEHGDPRVPSISDVVRTFTSPSRQPYWGIMPSHDDGYFVAKIKDVNQNDEFQIPSTSVFRRYDSRRSVLSKTSDKYAAYSPTNIETVSGAIQIWNTKTGDLADLVDIGWYPSSIQFGGGEDRFLVMDTRDSDGWYVNVTVVDLASPTPHSATTVNIIVPGEQAKRVYHTPDEIIVLYMSGRVDRYNLANFSTPAQSTSQIQLPFNLTDISIETRAADHNSVYWLLQSNILVQWITAQAQAPESSIRTVLSSNITLPSYPVLGMALHPDGNILYLVNGAPSESVRMFDVRPGSEGLVGTMTPQTQYPAADVSVSATGRYLWIACGWVVQQIAL
ncbi:uncharacterized protein EV422DRAFT_523718 [Fimicolochytrium jonesii]|uniref:uncharacterized protein n=1 Tax=Fimicolochytrium jonesii TaxID=1396493 RepID=UPI0022FDB708|nr:uncharacterized protein EV422DRAFT_523718 [Fimicolochytrium jonesii]KAI8823195.1 hypothetical protein EV422DRAFT_523718 [Fimicolochytrium jonesii]